MGNQNGNCFRNIVGVIFAGIVIAIYAFLPETTTPRATLLIDIATILLTGLVVGVLGMGAEQAVKNIATHKAGLKTSNQNGGNPPVIV